MVPVALQDNGDDDLFTHVSHNGYTHITLNPNPPAFQLNYYVITTAIASVR